MPMIRADIVRETLRRGEDHVKRSLVQPQERHDSWPQEVRDQTARLSATLRPMSWLLPSPLLLVAAAVLPLAFL